MCGQWLKESSEILADENLKFFWKRSKCKNFPRSQKFFPKWEGNLKQRGNASLPQGGWTPQDPAIGYILQFGNRCMGTDVVYNNNIYFRNLYTSAELKFSYI